jgi:predicted RNA-binding protein with RPS1 domain
MTAEAEVGKIYRGKVVTIKEFGAFVEFLPGKDGLVHISELANFRVKKTEDIVKIGDEITVKCLGVDEKGRVRLSRKAAMEDRDRGNGQLFLPKPRACKEFRLCLRSRWHSNTRVVRCVQNMCRILSVTTRSCWN